MKKKYLYSGEVAVIVPGIGVVNPGEVIETEKEIKNINFKLVKSSKKKGGRKR